MKSDVQATCNRLAERGVLVRRGVGVGGLRSYRLPLELKPGLMVIENPNTLSQRCGWIEEMKILRTTGEEKPIVRWLSGLRSFSSDELLEPVEDVTLRERIKVAQAVARGETPEGFVEIPWYVLSDLILPADSRGKSRINTEMLLEVAKLLGLLKPDAVQISGTTHNRCIDYLDAYYPDWRTQQLRRSA